MTPTTARDRLDQLLRFVHRASRYWWLTAGLVVLGGVLSVLFALTRPKVYQSGAVLYYQERLQTSLLQNRDVSTMHRNIGERYRELLLARSSLVEVIRDPAVNPFPDILASDGEDEAVEALRDSVGFRPRGANTFVITYQDRDPDRAKAVTQRLTTLLRDKAAAVRVDAAQATAKFAAELRTEALEELRARQRKLNEFLVANPEFVTEAAAGSGAGAAVRAMQDKNKKDPGDGGGGGGSSVLSALERHRARILARIANPTAPIEAPTPTRRERTPEQQAADAEVAEVERELAAAQRRLEETQAKFTDRHPDVLKAKDALDAAKARLASAKAAVPPDPVVDEPVPQVPADPAVLQKQLAEVERQIAAEKARAKPGAVVTAPDVGAAAAASSVVKTEDDYQRLKLDVDEQKQRVDALADSAFRAELEAQQRIAEQGDSLSIVDGAYKPLRPMGKPKKKLVLVGLVVFTLLGLGLACGLALLDDRVYQRDDLLAVTTAPVLAVIPRARAGRRWLPGARRRAS